MCRSVIIKGLEAMVVEAFTAARAHGVENEVVASLAETFPGIDWEKQGAYIFERVIQHGRRRAEEMQEAAETVREAGLEPWSARATAERQAWVADLVDQGVMGDPAGRADWRVAADRILRASRKRPEVRLQEDMDPDWLPFHPHPSKPVFAPPPGAVDAHCHVFGPAEQFPFAPERKYTPCDASKEQLFALRDFLGFERNVIVQATCHGHDNRALVDALKSSSGRARGVASVGPEVTDAELRALNDAGVRGARFNFVRRLVDFTPREVLSEIARRVAPLGWHVVVYLEARDLPELSEFFTSLPTPVVFDHMARPDVIPAGGRAGVRTIHPAVARAPHLLVEGELSRAVVAVRPPGLRGRGALRPAAWSRPFRTGCSGAPTGRIPT